MCKSLLEAILNGMKVRFNEYLFFPTGKAQKAAIPALSHPRIKNMIILSINVSKIKSNFSKKP